MAVHKGRGFSAIEYPTGMNQNGDPSQAWMIVGEPMVPPRAPSSGAPHRSAPALRRERGLASARVTPPSHFSTTPLQAARPRRGD
jgi:hypothetical protein